MKIEYKSVFIGTFQYLFVQTTDNDREKTKQKETPESGQRKTKTREAPTQALDGADAGRTIQFVQSRQRRKAKCCGRRVAQRTGTPTKTQRRPLHFPLGSSQLGKQRASSQGLLRESLDKLGKGMAMSKQELLQEAWNGGRVGALSPQTQARAWGLREAWRDEHGEKTYGMLTHIASKLYTVTAPKAKKEHPTAAALHQLFERIDGDKAWFPGKSEQLQRGPKPAINGTNQAVIARSAMNIMASGKEPTYSAIVAHNPKATLNPETKRPVDKKIVYNLVKKRCYDDANNPEDTWTHDYRYSKKALTETQQKNRWDWAKEVPQVLLNPDWCYKNLIWTDICNSILANCESMHHKQVMARKGRKGWGSKATRKKSKNLVGDKGPIKQNQWGTTRVWWAPILSRGKLHIEILGTNFPGENADGAAVLAAHVRKVVNMRFRGADQPKTLFLDRGQGFWDKTTGIITEEFKAALRENSLKTFYGDDASAQPGALHEVHLHETSVSWIRYQESQTRPREAWKETVDEFTTRMRGIAQDINSRLDVDGLCRALPKRLAQLKANTGDRINQYSAYLIMQLKKQNTNLSSVVCGSSL